MWCCVFITPVLGRPRQADPWDSWASQPSLLSKFQASSETLSQKIRWHFLRNGTPSRMTSVFNMHVHTCKHTHTRKWSTKLILSNFYKVILAQTRPVDQQIKYLPSKPEDQSSGPQNSYKKKKPGEYSGPPIIPQYKRWDVESPKQTA